MGVSGQQFLDSDGAIELLCELDPIGSQFSELDEELPISHTTLTTRLGEAQELTLIEKRLVEKNGKQVTVYSPTNSGARIMLELRRNGVVETYHVLKDMRSRFEKKSDAVREWVDENAMYFEPHDDDYIKELHRHIGYEHWESEDDS